MQRPEHRRVVNNNMISNSSNDQQSTDHVNEPQTLTFTLDVQEDPETGEQYILLSPEILAKSGFNEGDILEWILDEENESSILRKAGNDYD